MGSCSCSKEKQTKIIIRDLSRSLFYIYLEIICFTFIYKLSIIVLLLISVSSFIFQRFPLEIYALPPFLPFTRISVEQVYGVSLLPTFSLSTPYTFFIFIYYILDTIEYHAFYQIIQFLYYFLDFLYADFQFQVL